MQLEKISVTNFKNIVDARLTFSASINCLLGNNGMGKSNLLDAIYFLSYCRSFSGIADKALMNDKADFFSVNGDYLRNGMQEALNVGMNRGKRKVLKRKGKEYSRLSEHIGAFPLVLAAPQDTFLITGSGEERRKLMDMIISQSDANYLQALIRYQRALEQRNKLLRAGVNDTTLYEAIEMILAESAAVIHNLRGEWLPRFEKIFGQYYRAIAGSGESVQLRRKTHLSAEDVTMKSLLDRHRMHDQAVGYTSVGPHRDDIEIFVNSLEARHTASQGQCKTIAVSMRLAQFDFLKEATGITPILLLDDIFDKLDALRVENIVRIVGSERFGQIFITDTNRDHLDNILRDTALDRSMWTVENGHFIPIEKPGI